MKHIIIDTDTASDDAVALIMALRDPEVKVEAVTVVAGNVPLEQAVKNALISIEVAGTYHPSVYKGLAKPILRDLVTAENVHGDDGLGDAGYEVKTARIESEHAIDAMIRIIDNSEHELELVTLGPLTNVAVACLKAPETMKKLRRITIMGGSGLGPGNMTPVAEFNIYVDAEAAQIVLNSGVDLFIVGWDVSLGEAFINDRDMQTMIESGNPVADFCVRCNSTLASYNFDRFAIQGFDLPDPVTMAAALYPEIVLDTYRAYTYAEINSPTAYGHLVIDHAGLLHLPPNTTICAKIDAGKFKEKLFKAVCY